MIYLVWIRFGPPIDPLGYTYDDPGVFCEIPDRFFKPYYSLWNLE
jgi:hypothetical protein